MIYSFVLIPAPQLCESQMFKRHRSFVRSRVDGTNTEIFDVIAINCTSKYDIPGKIYDISTRYLTMPPTEENIKTAVWSSACRSALMEETYGSTPTQEMMNTLAMYNINVNQTNCIYIPLDGAALSITEQFVASYMLSKK